jgi:hypothetical protein
VLGGAAVGVDGTSGVLGGVVVGVDGKPGVLGGVAVGVDSTPGVNVLGGAAVGVDGTPGVLGGVVVGVDGTPGVGVFGGDAVGVDGTPGVGVLGGIASRSMCRLVGVCERSVCDILQRATNTPRSAPPTHTSQYSPQCSPRFWGLRPLPEFATSTTASLLPSDENMTANFGFCERTPERAKRVPDEIFSALGAPGELCRMSYSLRLGPFSRAD